MVLEMQFSTVEVMPCGKCCNFTFNKRMWALDNIQFQVCIYLLESRSKHFTVCISFLRGINILTDKCEVRAAAG